MEYRLIRSYLRVDNGDGLLLIVFNERSECVFAMNVDGSVYPPDYWSDEDAFSGKHHFRQFESTNVNT